MKKSISIILLFIFCCLTILDAQTKIEKSKIYEKILKLQLANKDTNNKRLIFLDTTISCNYNINFTDTILKKYLNIDPHVYIDFMKIIEISKSFKDTTRIKESIADNVIVAEKNIFLKTKIYNKNFIKVKTELDLEKAWGNFYKRNICNGICKLSRPYFFNENTAIIYCTINRGILNAWGGFYLLKKLDNDWEIIYCENIWCS